VLVTFLGFRSCYTAVQKECATPPHVSLHDWVFTRPSPALGLQATNAGMRRLLRGYILHSITKTTHWGTMCHAHMLECMLQSHQTLPRFKRAGKLEQCTSELQWKSNSQIGSIDMYPICTRPPHYKYSGHYSGHHSGHYSGHYTQDTTQMLVRTLLMTLIRILLYRPRTIVRTLLMTLPRTLLRRPLRILLRTLHIKLCHINYSTVFPRPSFGGRDVGGDFGREVHDWTADIQKAVPLATVKETATALCSIPLITETLSTTLPALSFSW